MAFAALSNSGPPVWFGLAAAAVFAVAGVAWVMAAVLGAGLTAVLAGPCSRGLMPGERALNVDLLGAPSPEEVLPNWLRRLEVAPPGAIPPAPVAPSPAPAPDAEGHTAEEPLAD